MCIDRQTGQIPKDVINNVSKVCMNLLRERPTKNVYKVEVDPSFYQKINEAKSAILSAKKKQDTLIGKGSGMFSFSYAHIKDSEARKLFGAILIERSIDTDRATPEYLSQVGPEIHAMISELGGPESTEPRDEWEGFMKKITMPMMVESVLSGQLKLEPSL